MTLQEIKSAVDSGLSVCWVNHGYRVIRKNDDYFVVFTANGYTNGLTYGDGQLSGNEFDFYILED